MANEVTIKKLNLIRSNSGTTYKELVPKFTTKNFDLKLVSTPVLTNPIARNDFINGLFNMIGKTTTTGLEYDVINPYSRKYIDGFDLGAYEREVALDLIDEKEYSFTESGISEMFKLHLPTVAQAFHKINRQKYFPLTISYVELKRAFNDDSSLDSFLAKYDNLLIQSNKAKEYEWARDLIPATVNRGYVNTVIVDDVIDETSANAFIKTVKKLVAHFQFVGKEGTQISNMNSDLSISTWCPTDKVDISINADLKVDIDVDLLAKAFNKTYVELENSMYEFDSLGYYRKEGETEGEYTYYKILAMVNDERFIRIRNVLKEMWDSSLTTVMAFNKNYHVWQSYSTSPFVRAYALITPVDETEIPDGYFDNLPVTVEDTESINELTSSTNG